MLSLLAILISLFLIFCIVIFVNALKKGESNSKEGVLIASGIAAVLSAIVTFFLVITVLELIYTVATTEATIDKKIALYEESNSVIEERISSAVSAYMDFEASTYGELQATDAITLVSLFPELKSDALVQQQIEIYVKNNQELLQLKEAKINLTKQKWLLYFGT